MHHHKSNPLPINFDFRNRKLSNIPARRCQRSESTFQNVSYVAADWHCMHQINQNSTQKF